VAVQAAIVNCTSCHQRSGKDPNSPQPSYVGERYPRGGLVVLLQNPGSPPKDWQNEERETRLAQAIGRFRDASSVENYRAIVTEIHKQMTGDGGRLPPWRSWLHPVAKCVQGVAAPTDFAWVNVVKHRTPGDVDTNRATLEQEEAHGLREHLSAELEILNPKVVLAVGSPAMRALSNLSGSWRTFAIGQRARAEEADKIRLQLGALLPH
jgi:hypothetical protein